MQQPYRAMLLSPLCIFFASCSSSDTSEHCPNIIPTTAQPESLEVNIESFRIDSQAERYLPITTVNTQLQSDGISLLINIVSADIVNNSAAFTRTEDSANENCDSEAAATYEYDGNLASLDITVFVRNSGGDRVEADLDWQIHDFPIVEQYLNSSQLPLPLSSAEDIDLYVGSNPKLPIQLYVSGITDIQMSSVLGLSIVAVSSTGISFQQQIDRGR